MFVFFFLSAPDPFPFWVAAFSLLRVVLEGYASAILNVVKTLSSIQGEMLRYAPRKPDSRGAQFL